MKLLLSLILFLCLICIIKLGDRKTYLSVYNIKINRLDEKCSEYSGNYFYYAMNGIEAGYQNSCPLSSKFFVLIDKDDELSVDVVYRHLCEGKSAKLAKFDVDALVREYISVDPHCLVVTIHE